MKNILISASLLVAMAVSATAQNTKKPYAREAVSKSTGSVARPHHTGPTPGRVVGGAAKTGPSGGVGEQLKQLERQTSKTANSASKAGRPVTAEKSNREEVQKRGGINFSYQAPKTGSHSASSAHGSGSKTAHRTSR